MRDNALLTTLFGAAFVAGFTLGLIVPNRFPERSYDLVQVDRATGESDIIDYDLTADDCRDGMRSVRNTFCE